MIKRMTWIAGLLMLAACASTFDKVAAEQNASNVSQLAHENELFAAKAVAWAGKAGATTQQVADDGIDPLSLRASKSRNDGAVNLASKMAQDAAR